MNAPLLWATVSVLSGLAAAFLVGVGYGQHLLGCI